MQGGSVCSHIRSSLGALKEKSVDFISSKGVRQCLADPVCKAEIASLIPLERLRSFKDFEQMSANLPTKSLCDNEIVRKDPLSRPYRHPARLQVYLWLRQWAFLETLYNDALIELK
jgi:hypothetical protein